MAKIKAVTYLWIVWFEIAVERELAANKARMASKVESLGEQYVSAQDDELRASMVSVSAGAHSIDAFYGTVSYDIVLPDGLREKWEENRAPRRARILETLKHGFDVGGKAERWAGELRWLFDLRDAAVHHEPEPKPVGDHPSGRVLVAQENIAYSSEAATRAVDLALDVIASCLRTPKASQTEIHAWASEEKARAQQLEEVRDPGGILRRWSPRLE